MTTRELSLSSRSPLGDRPLAFLSEGRGGAGLVLRLVAHGDGFLGLVPARAQLAERLRLGLVPVVAFVGPHGERLSGAARVTLRGRADADAAWARVAAVVDPFGAADALVVEVEPLALAIDPADEESHGSCPRT